ncbi:6-phosphogluconate dehydrogenase [Amylocystis lapponica]|nr:6-phosphogluconate dehydrogenase [Amylocystis lapponica]
MSPTLAVVSAGAMGSAVARRLVTAGCTVLTNLDGRSPATRARAHDAGMLDVPLPELAARAEWVLSILPPRDALAFAAAFRAAHQASGFPASAAAKVAFADCNAVSPDTVRRIAALFAGSAVAFVDAGIIGGPPRAGYDPVFYASAAREDGALLDAFVALSRYGGAEVGAASALKMSYAGITKGFTGLCTAMILGDAHASSPATSEALLRELHASQPQILQRAVRAVPDMVPKAYRWVAEMEEIAAFVGAGEGDIHRGMARVYERGEGGDVAVLRKFVEDAKRLGGQE